MHQEKILTIFKIAEDDLEKDIEYNLPPKYLTERAIRIPSDSAVKIKKK